MSLTILSVAYPLAPVGRDAAGGAEQIAAALDRALVAAGHRSLVVACEGSDIAGTHLAIPHYRELDPATRRAAQSATRLRILQALQRYPVDLVHFHGIDAAEYLPLPTVPSLVTLHLPPSWYPDRLFRLERVHLVCVSDSERRVCQPAPSVTVVHNGVPVERLAADYKKRGFALALGRICPEKGFHLALDAARQSGMKLLLAGELFGYPDHQSYFAREIRPRLDRDRRYLGPVGFHAKRRLLTQARCLLAPSLVPETASLVAMEALACGTPVVAFPAGALADLIQPGLTGYLPRDATEMAAMLGGLDRIDPQACRSFAHARCSEAAMTKAYLDLYQRQAAGALRQAV